MAVAVYWFARRALPTTHGDIKAPISRIATISRDALGVPHINATSIEDAMFLQGFATAQDRLWQMDNLRRFAAGELAEVYGPSVVEQDRLSRAMQMRSIAERYINSATHDELEPFEAYARGVNFFIDQNRGKYGIEFSIP